MQNEEGGGFRQGLFLAVQFGLQFRRLLFVKFCGDHVAVAGVLHCGKREVSPGLEFAERDAVLFAELVEFIDAQALRLRDKAELCKRGSFYL